MERQALGNNVERYTTHIKAHTGWLEINLRELAQYKDLIYLFVKRNYVTRYKQTILGPLWLVLNPLITVLLYSFVFGSIAGFSTDGSPQLSFYMASNSIWSYFAYCLNQTSTTFTSNSAVFGKVYFPRLTVPISTVMTGILDLFVQLIMLFVVNIIYTAVGTPVNVSLWIMITPVLIIQTAMLALGCGIIISSLTTKYRDLVVVVGFGVQLWMYASPVVYSMNQIPEKYMNLYMLNPMSPIITIWRYALLGTGEFPRSSWGYSWIITIGVLVVGIILFNRIEKNFMDTV